MILEIDYGNTRLKWRLLDCNNFNCISRGSVMHSQDILQAIQGYLQVPIRYCRVSSVRAAHDNHKLEALVDEWFKLKVNYAVATEQLAGVVNGYADATKLGVDRWLAIVAAYIKVKKACVVLDCGTALTADFINEAGVHLGGCIAPGLRLLSAALTINAQQLAGTAAVISEHNVSACGVNTQSAIACGVTAMLSGFVKEQLLTARHLLGSDFRVICTGGDAVFVFREVSGADVDEDLVFKGLAIACPFAVGV